MPRTRDEAFLFDGVKLKRLPIFMAGTPVDGRAEFTKGDLNKLVTSTKKLMRDRGHQPTAKLGHAGWGRSGREQQPRRGFLKKVFRGQFEAPNGNSIEAIFADVIVDKELADDYAAGKYPGISAELYPLEWLAKETWEEIENGEWFIDAIAFLGEDNPAFPELFKRRTPGEKCFSVIRIDPRQEKPMTVEEKFKALAEKFAALAAGENFAKEESLASLDTIIAEAESVKAYVEELEDDSDDDDDTTGDAGATDDNAATKAELAAANAEIVKLKAEVKGNHKQPKDQSALQAKFDALQTEVDTLKAVNTKVVTDERDKIFNVLVADGKCTKQERKVFDVIADTEGLAYARNQYAAKESTKGPQSKLFASITNAPDDPEYRKFMASLERAGLNKDEMQAHSDEYRKLVAEGQIPSTAGVN
jgi:hypothetical protein